MSESVRERELRPVGRSPERDLVDAEHLPDGFEVLRMLVCGVEVSLRSEAGGALGREGGLDVDRHGVLQRGAPQHSGVPRASVVVRDERVAREEIAVQRRRAERAEVEYVSRSLAGAARDEEDHASRWSERRQSLDVQ